MVSSIDAMISKTFGGKLRGEQCVSIFDTNAYVTEKANMRSTMVSFFSLRHISCRIALFLALLFITSYFFAKTLQ